MLSVNNISYFVGDRPLYLDASLHIQSKDRIGLIGLNGQGKTTLLKIITGEYGVDKGDISLARECTVGFLNQDLLSFESNESILTVAMSAFADAISVQRKINECIHKLETAYSDKLVDRLTRLQERFEALQGYSIQARAEELLEGIGFETAELEKPLMEFSGGWRMRVMLAKLLLEKPSLLLLDEPTNHLDLPSIEWLETYLSSYEGAYIVVSHDRRFLNATTSKTVEVENGSLVMYEGNYDFYKSEKEQRAEIQNNSFKNQQQKIKQTERFIQRFRAKSTKARQVQSKIKQLERMDLVDEVMDSQATVNFRFQFQQKSGKNIVQLNGIKKVYGDNVVLENSSARIDRGDKIALIGANGKGKSTLLRIIDGTEKIQMGSRKEGYNVIKAFYAQHQLEALHLNNEIIEELKQAGSNKSEQELRNVLGCFLFSGDDIYKKIKVLSGGEKSRVALAKTLISEANFLLLDEPTNHLDFLSENILIQALQQYQGSFLIVSHNRHFISQTTNKVWYIENREVKEYPGTYEEYEYWRSINTAKSQDSGVASQQALSKGANDSSKKRPAKKRGPVEVSLKKLQANLEKVEEQLGSSEKKVKELETLLSQPEIYADPDRLMTINQEYHAAKKLFEEISFKWDSLAEKIDLTSAGGVDD